MTHVGSLLLVRIDGNSIDRNVAIFDHLRSAEDKITSEFGLPLIWKEIHP